MVKAAFVDFYHKPHAHQIHECIKAFFFFFEIDLLAVSLAMDLCVYITGLSSFLIVTLLSLGSFCGWGMVLT